MAPPFRRGDTAAWLSVDPEGMRVHRAQVLDVEPENDGWRVSTTHGVEHVDRSGEGLSLVPADEEISVALANRGDGFLVEITTRDIEADLSLDVDWDELAREIDRERDERGWSW